MDSKLEEIAEILRQELKKNIPQVVLNKETLTDISESIQGLYVPLEMRLAEQDREIERLRRVFKGVCVEAGERQELLEEAEARVKELEELLGEEIYAERAAVRHYKRIKELEEAIRRHQERDWSEKSPPYSDWDEELYALLKEKV